MDRTDLQHLSKEQLIELVLQLQRPDKNSRTSSKPPSTDKKEKRENSRPGGAKLGHEPHNRRLWDHPQGVSDHPRTLRPAGRNWGMSRTTVGLRTIPMSFATTRRAYASNAAELSRRTPRGNWSANMTKSRFRRAH